MARAGDDLGYYYVEGYIDEDYIRYEPYIETGYITDDYFQGEGAVIELDAQTMAVAATQTVAVGRIRQGSINIAGAMNASIFAVASKNGSIDMATALTMSTDAERTRSSDVVLATIINLSLQGDRIRGASSAISSSFTTTQTALRIKPLETALAVSASTSTTILRIKPLASDLGAAFTPTMLVNVSRNGSTDLVTTTTLAATSTRIKPLAVDPIATSTALYARPAFQLILFASNQSSAFTQTVEARKPTRVPTVVVQSFEDDGNPYDSADITNSTYKFGGGSLELSQTLSSVWGNIRYGYLGSTLTGVAPGFTITSTDDGETWTQTTNNLSVSPTYIFFTGTEIAVLNSNTAYTTTNGTSWTTVTGMNGSRGLVKAGSFWYNLSYSNSSDVWRIYRGTSLSNLAAQTTVWHTISTVNPFSESYIYSDGTTLFWTNTQTNTSTIKINDNIINGFGYLSNTPALVSNGKILLSSSDFTATRNYGVYNTSGTGNHYATPNEYGVVPTYFDGTNIVLETKETGQIYSGTLNSLTAQHNFEDPEIFERIAYFKNGSEYTRIKHSIAYKSTDLNTWTDYLVTAARNERPYVKVDNGTHFSNTWGTIDFWANTPDRSRSVTLLQNSDPGDSLSTSGEDGWEISIGLGVGFAREDNTVNTYSGTTITNNTWHHIRVTKDASDNVGLYVDGTRYDTDVFPNLSLNSNGLNIFGGSFVNNSIRIDELFVTTDILSDPTTVTSFTVPTTAWTDPADGTTQLLMHFDTDFADDAPPALGAELYVRASVDATTNANFLGNAELASAFALAVDTVKIEQMAATTLSSASTITATVGVVKQANSALNAIFSQTVSYGRIRQAVTSLNSAFAQNTINTRTRDYDSALSAIATQTATIGSIKQFEVDYTAFNTQIAVVAKIGDFLVDYAGQFGITTSAVATLNGEVDYASEFGQTASALATLSGEVDYATQTTLTATPLRTRPAEAELSTSATLGADVGAIRQGELDVTASFDLDTDTSGFVGLVLTDLSASTNISTTALRIKQLSSTLDSTLTQSADVDRVVGFSAEITGAATLNATVGVIKQFDVDLTAFNTQVAVVARRAAGVANLDSAFTIATTVVVFAENETIYTVSTALSVDALRTRSTGAQTIECVATQTANVTKAVEAQVSLTGAFAPSIEINATRDSDIELNAQFAATVEPTVVRSGEISTNTSATLAVAATATLAGAVDLASATQIVANAGKLVSAGADIASAMTFVVSLKEIHLTQYVYTIPKDLRIYTVERESRAHTIQKETRTYTIEGE